MGHQRSSEIPDGSPRQVPVAIVIEGVTDTWQMNVLQLLVTPASADVVLDGYETIETPAWVLSPEQARRLAAQIVELVGSHTTAR